jgi:hypothetical protein
LDYPSPSLECLSQELYFILLESTWSGEIKELSQGMARMLEGTAQTWITPTRALEYEFRLNHALIEKTPQYFNFVQ